MDLMPSDERPVVDLAAFDAAIGRYAAALRELDKLKETDPSGASIIDGQAGSWLGSLREYRQKLGRARGDARRAGGHEAHVDRQQLQHDGQHGADPSAGRSLGQASLTQA
jgi:hypothetical protein